MTDRFPWFCVLYQLFRLNGRSPGMRSGYRLSSPPPACLRHTSIADAASTLITSAPNAASVRPAIGPAQAVVSSSTVTPASGSARSPAEAWRETPAARRAGATAPDGTVASAESKLPGRSGAGRAPASGVPVIRNSGPSSSRSCPSCSTVRQ